ncbi:poly [ADP-ribose] polymerase 2 [Brachionus plicatilis]|uniref:Poly [ADP-ribose] polymerase n=1 Tax=Brachionus plicatilis TaxID=10195 RepID=A0A3M7RF07_BRAPC|nr:poly [ADP-ribose] polymerase 2 [Brachionus plicatilis]
MNFNFRWEWLNSSQDQKTGKIIYEWTLFDDKIKKILTDAFDKNMTKTQYDIGGTYFEAFLDSRSMQKNKKTGYERKIRMCISQDKDDAEGDTDKNWYTWQWLNEDNIWLSFSPYKIFKLEKDYLNFMNNNSNSSNILKINFTDLNKTYVFDFQQMTQTNEKSKYKRKIKRVASDITNSYELKTENIGGRSLRKRSSINYNESKQCVKSEPVNQDSDCEKQSESFIDDCKNDSDFEIEKLKEESDFSDQENENESENESENDEPIKKKRKSCAKSASKNEEENTFKTIKYTGDIPLDEKFTETVGFEYKIYREGDVIYDCMLNQTNLQYNNNKYYLIQLIEKIKNKEYLVWMRWGRVGKAGQFSVQNFGNDLNQAKDVFAKKFFDKTKNEWEDKETFEKYPGKYDLVYKDYDSIKTEIEESENKKIEPKKEVPPSQLDQKVQDILDLICNISEMESVLKEMKYDSKRAPLGKLSKSQIKAGYSVLKEIEDLLKNSKSSNNQYVELSNSFYTRIPHDFGMKVPTLINTSQKLREKLKLLELLEDVEVAVSILNKKTHDENPIDKHYEQLNCSLKPLDHNDKMFSIIEQYIANTHAPTHNTYKLKLLDVFEAEKPSEKEKFVDHGNRMLLWHGSRLTNWAGILSQGLRIAPPEAPVTGYMFGKGCYFADCSSKSANYCYPTSTKNVGILSLSEVSLGNFNELKQADNNADKLPKGKVSTKGVGRSQPDKSEWITLEDGCIVPCGKLKCAIDKKDLTLYSLLYNEYIVYNVDQIKLRYLVKIQFDFDE